MQELELIERKAIEPPGAVELDLLMQAIELARKSVRAGDHPFGAVIAVDGVVVETSQNYSYRSGHAWMHAEHSAIQRAVERMGQAALTSATLYSSTEPCAMCCGLIHWADISRLVYSCSISSFRAFRPHKEAPSCRDVFRLMGTNIEIVGPLIEDESVSIHEKYWPTSRPRRENGI